MSKVDRDPSGPDVTPAEGKRLTTASRWDETTIGRQSFRSPSIDWDACYVYVAWGHDRTRPLYVGKSREPLNRIGRHLRGTAWASHAVEWELLAFSSEDDAVRAESRAISQLRPINNAIGGSSGKSKRRFAPRPGRRGRMPSAHQAIPKPIHGIPDDQLAIIRRVQNSRGRAA